MEPYNLPYFQKSSLKWYLNLLFLFSLVFFGAISIYLLSGVIKEEKWTGLFFGLFSLMMTLFFLYLFATVAMKRFYIEIDKEKIRVKLPFKDITTRWEEVGEVNSYSYNSNVYVAILLKKDFAKKQTRTLSRSFNSLFSVPPYSYQIQTILFKDVNVERLLTTITGQINKSEERTIGGMEMTDSNEEVENNLIKAVLLSFLLCAVLGIIYGITIAKLEENFLVLPIFCSLLLISVFNRFFIEDSFNLGIRIIMGTLCFAQVPIALITANVLEQNISSEFLDIGFTAKVYISYLLQNPGDHIGSVITALVCFAMGALKGRPKGIEL